jgi:hypothetical protein
MRRQPARVNRAIGALERIEHECYRVDVGPDEDAKSAEGGAVEPRAEPGHPA